MAGTGGNIQPNNPGDGSELAEIMDHLAPPRHLQIICCWDLPQFGTCQAPKKTENTQQVAIDDLPIQFVDLPSHIGYTLAMTNSLLLKMAKSK